MVQVSCWATTPWRDSREADDALMETRVIAVDVGSVLTNFAWAGLDLPGRRLVSGGGARPDEAAVSVLAALTSGIRVALGFEAPLVLPVSPVDQVDGWKTLGKARQGETVDGRSRPWSAGAGSGALATGLMQMAWVLERVGSELPGMACTTRPEVWLSGESGLLVWEAFVSGTGKPVPAGTTQHAADAAAAADSFADRLEAGTLGESDVVCAPMSSFNLAAAAAPYANMTIGVDELRLPVPVYRTRPALLYRGLAGPSLKSRP